MLSLKESSSRFSIPFKNPLFSFNIEQECRTNYSSRSFPYLVVLLTFFLSPTSFETQSQKPMKVLIILISLAFLFLQSCSNAPEGKNESNDENASLSIRTLNIALKPNKNIQAQRVDEKSLGQALEKVIGIPVNISTPNNKTIIEAGLANKTIDVGYVSSSDAISFADNEVAEVLVAGQHESVDAQGNKYKGPYYFSVWLTLKDRPYKSIADLKGKKIAFSSRTSTSGYLIPCWDLIKKGIIPEGGSLKDFFGENNIFFGTGYVSAVEQVLEGKAEAAAVSYYVYEKDKHLERVQREKLKVIQRQGPVASHTFCARMSLNSSDRNIIKDALIQIVEDEPELSQSLFGGTLTSVNASEHLKAPRNAKLKVSTLKD